MAGGRLELITQGLSRKVGAEFRYNGTAIGDRQTVSLAKAYLFYGSGSGTANLTPILGHAKTNSWTGTEITVNGFQFQ